MNGVLAVLLSLLFEGCVATSQYKAIAPVYPKPPNYFGTGKDPLGRYKDPANLPTVDSVTPTFVWKSSDPGVTTYDLAICVGVAQVVNSILLNVVFKPGKQVYYREAIQGTTHRVAEALENNTVYVWSVRTRKGDDVGPWSTYDFKALAVTPIVTSWEAGKNLWWPFKTPAGPRGVLAGSEPSKVLIPGSNLGRIYFFREKRFVGSAQQPHIRMNGEVIGNAMSGGYFYLDLPAGAYIIGCDTWRGRPGADVSITVEGGQTKYVRTSLKHGQIVPTVEEPSVAIKALKNCSYMHATFHKSGPLDKTSAPTP